MSLIKLQENIGHNFLNLKLLENALVHKSYLNDSKKIDEIAEHNERLEFLGDAVLELVVSEHLFKNLNEAEGMMTYVRSGVVNTQSLAEVGKNIGLDNLVFLSRNEKSELGKARDSIVADAVEAIIGAIYLDGGLSKSQVFIEKYILVKIPEIIKNKSWKDSKTVFQELSQEKFKTTPKYKVIQESGLDHNKTFTVAVFLGDEKIATGQGSSKQRAETQAASEALEVIKNLI